jgi:riboflavin kinase/FMN adenylyltransferase
MRVVYCVGKDPSIAPLGRAVVSIGAFDGIHLEHRRLLERARAVAAEEDARAVAVILWPDAHQSAAPADEPRLLTTLDERLALVAGLALVDAAVVLPFDPTRPDAALEALAAICEPVALVVGTDPALDEDATRGLRLVRVDGRDARTSEAEILGALRDGQLDAATERLGHAYALGGEVVAGDRRGRTIGFPTANLRLDPRKALPANGVYAVRVGLPGESEKPHPGVCNIGVRPTFGGELRLLVEIHLLDATMDLYGLTLGVELVARLRDERRFTGIDELKAQIARDAESARTLLARPSRTAPSRTAPSRSA